MKPTPPTVRAALYADGDTVDSTNAQFGACQALVTGQGWRVVGVYVDHAPTSGTRYNYLALLGDIRAGRIDRVVINAPDRLHRTPADVQEYLNLCAESGVDTWVANSEGPYQLDPQAVRPSSVTARAIAQATIEAASFGNLHQPSPLPNGARVEITGVTNIPNLLPIGIRGTVVGGNGSQLWVLWDNGSGIGLVVGKDPYRVVSQA